MVGYKVDLMICVNMFFFRVLVMNPRGRIRRSNTNKKRIQVTKTLYSCFEKLVN